MQRLWHHLRYAGRQLQSSWPSASAEMRIGGNLSNVVSGIAAVLLLSSALASYLAAQRATRIDPPVVLRDG